MKFSYSKRTRHHFRTIDNTTAFLDIVGFTKLGDNEHMRRAIQDLHSAISDVFDRYQWDEDDQDNDLIMIPSGDGYGIAFCDEISDEIILELIEKLYKMIVATMGIRIGISKGPNIVFFDLNDKLNIIGWGINRAQRVMSVAEKNQILCDSLFAERLLKMKHRESLLRVGSTKVKHGEVIEVYNYYKEEGVGNKEVPSLMNKDI